MLVKFGLVESLHDLSALSLSLRDVKLLDVLVADDFGVRTVQESNKLNIHVEQSQQACEERWVHALRGLAILVHDHQSKRHRENSETKGVSVGLLQVLDHLGGPVKDHQEVDQVQRHQEHSDSLQKTINRLSKGVLEEGVLGELAVHVDPHDQQPDPNGSAHHYLRHVELSLAYRDDIVLLGNAMQL